MDARQIADLILAHLALPEDLRGRYVNLVGFPDEKTCRHFYPHCSLDEHEAACALIGLEVAKRGGATCRTVKAALSSDEAGSQDARTKIADRHTYLVPVPGTVTTWEGYDPAIKA